MHRFLRGFSSAAKSVGAALKPDLLYKSNSNATSYVARSAADTEAIGRALGSVVKRGHLVLLQGKLGVGKTVFARGFVRGACHDDALEVNSPTFLLDNSYLSPSGAVVHHMDMYRIRGPDDVTPLGLRGVFMTDISIVEWPQRLAGFLPEEHLLVKVIAEDDEEFPASARITAAPSGALGALQQNTPSAFDLDDMDVDDNMLRAVTFAARGRAYNALLDELKHALPFPPVTLY